MAWQKLDEGPTESPLGGVRQKLGEPLADFINRVEQSVKCKLPTGNLREQFIKLMVWEGMNADHRTACAGLRDASLSRWVIASQDLGTQQHQTKNLAMALQMQTTTLTEALTQALAIREGGNL